MLAKRRALMFALRAVITLVAGGGSRPKGAVINLNAAIRIERVTVTTISIENVVLVVAI